MKIEGLPESVPEASTSHAVTAFSFNPVGCVEDGKDAWEKWDGPLNRLLQRDAKQLCDLIVQGARCLISLHNFLHYLVTAYGVKGAFFEMKIEWLIEAIDEVYVLVFESPVTRLEKDRDRTGPQPIRTGNL